MTSFDRRQYFLPEQEKAKFQKEIENAVFLSYKLSQGNALLQANYLRELAAHLVENGYQPEIFDTQKETLFTNLRKRIISYLQQAPHKEIEEKEVSNSVHIEILTLGSFFINHGVENSDRTEFLQEFLKKLLKREVQFQRNSRPTTVGIWNPGSQAKQRPDYRKSYFIEHVVLGKRWGYKPFDEMHQELRE